MGVQGLSRTRTIPQLAAYPYPTDGQVDVPPAFRCDETPNPCAGVPGNDGRTPTGFISSMQFNGPWEVILVSVSDAAVVPDIDGAVHVRTFGPAPVRITTSSTKGAGPATTVTPVATSTQAYAADARPGLTPGTWTVCADQDTDLVNDYTSAHVCAQAIVLGVAGPKTSPPSSRRLTAPRHLTAR
jgi:hypothetical protein